MKAFCNICSDLFDEIVAIVSTPCGHTFHDVCLLQWLEQSKTCPSCRKFVTAKNIRRIYFQIADEEEITNPDTLQNEIANLKATAKVQEMDKRKLSTENNEIREYVKIAEDKAEEFRQKYFESENKLDAMKTQLKYMTKQTAEMEWLKDENMQLHNELKYMQNVQSLISGTQNDVDEILKTCGNGQGALKQMTVYCSLLKKELQSATDTKTQLRNEIALLKKDLGCKTSEVNRKISEVNHLKNTVQQLEEENVSLEKKTKLFNKQNQNIDSILDSCVVYESPIPERLKRKHSSAEGADTSLSTTPVSERLINKKLKVNMLSSIVTNSKKSVETNNHVPLSFSSNVFRSQSSVISNDVNQKESVRIGYNGLGGHSRFVQRSCPVLAKVKPHGKKASISNSHTIDNYILL